MANIDLSTCSCIECTIAQKREPSVAGQYHEPSPPARRSVRLKQAMSYNCTCNIFASISNQHIHREGWTFTENAPAAQLPPATALVPTPACLSTPIRRRVHQHLTSLPRAAHLSPAHQRHHHHHHQTGIIHQQKSLIATPATYLTFNAMPEPTSGWW